ncbi:MAG: hypothetical protein GY944_30920 [bacterium]|nr:hypothetical protein [bacterium]
MTTDRDTLEPRSSDSEPDLAPMAPAAGISPSEAQGILQRLYSFRFTFGAIAIFVLLYIFTIRTLEGYLYDHFGELTTQAIEVKGLRHPVAERIQYRVDASIRNSLWTAIGGVDVSPMILGRDGITLIYVAGREPQPAAMRPTADEIVAEAARLLPASAVLSVSIPHNSILANSILIFYAALTMQVLWLRNLRNARRQHMLLERALEAREQSETRSHSIASELDQMRRRLLAIEPTDPEHVSEVAELREERKGLEAKLSALETREVELRESAARASQLGQEISALEDLLEEASDDLASRDSEIGELQKNLKRAAKGVASEQGGRMRESDVLARRFTTLYPKLEVDERAIQDIVSLRDETMKLKCEEKLKRLNDEADNLAVRRKVGGLPPHLTIFEMGFAGKGRLYYTKGSQRRFRVLNVGAKNTQNAAIEYLRKL